MSQSAAASPAGRHTLLALDPGHFHAALTLRRQHERLHEDVYVYARPGPDVDAFVRLVESFNARPGDGTTWRLHVYRGADPLERLLQERRGEVAVIAGRNDVKLDAIARLHAAGINVLGDKPWLIAPAQLPLVREVASTRPLAMDIMTERHDVANRLQRALAAREDVFGGFRTDRGAPAISIRSTHHLYKTVNGRALVRPEWYFDVKAQGEGITDVTTHLVDLAQWFVGGAPLDADRDVKLTAARQWPTLIPRVLYARITGQSDFPPGSSADVVDDALAYLCNAEIDFAVRGVPVHVESIWDLEIPQGGGDLHWCSLQGAHADLVVEQSAMTRFVPELFVRPHRPVTAYATALGVAIATLQPAFPGLAVDEADGGAFHVRIPQTLRTTHEQHFAAVLDQFLALVSGAPQPATLIPDLIAKYTLLAQAAQRSHAQ